MNQPYDLKALAEFIINEAKKEGLTIAEEGLEKLGKAIYLGSKAWAVESAILSENKIDDILSPFYNHADNFVMVQIDKIDLDQDGD